MFTRYAIALSCASILAACGNAPGEPCPVSLDNFPCHTAVVDDNGPTGNICSVLPVPDGQPCRTGVGVCASGACGSPPNTPAMCTGKAIGFSVDVCSADADCHGINLCADYSCPLPGLDACLILPKPDGTRCADNLACVHGECCLPMFDAACASDDGCHAIEECTEAKCGAGGLCTFTRSAPSAACVTSVGFAGRCIQHESDSVPRCLPTSG